MYVPVPAWLLAGLVVVPCTAGWLDRWDSLGKATVMWDSRLVSGLSLVICLGVVARESIHGR